MSSIWKFGFGSYPNSNVILKFILMMVVKPIK